MLAGEGFREVYNLRGGIKAWDGHTAVGPEDMGMGYLGADATLKDALELAYGMESGLGEFYRRVGADSSDERVVKTVGRLERIEEGHKKRVLELYRKAGPETTDQKTLESRLDSAVIEGGFTTDAFLLQNKDAMRTVDGVLSVAMMLETQALDLYARYARRALDRASRNALYDLSEEEKSHLALLGRLVEETIA
jgi:sulfur-carrier protein adenylyltransferase/sulfurtransferase